MPNEYKGVIICIFGSKETNAFWKQTTKETIKVYFRLIICLEIVLSVIPIYGAVENNYHIYIRAI